MKFNLPITLAQPVTQSGLGLHTGQLTTVRILPTEVDSGRCFVRVDLPHAPVIPAVVESVAPTALSTELVQANSDQDPSPSVRTVEHLLAALTGIGVSHARIEIDGPEVPLLDGSAQPWAIAIAEAGLTAVSPAGESFEDQVTAEFKSQTLSSLTHPISVQRGDAFVAAFPGEQMRFTYGIDFPDSVIGRQWYTWCPDIEDFAEAIAPARTFVLEAQVKQLQQMGLIKGGSLENAIVGGETDWLNPPLRFADEPVRHKLLDLVGDLSLLGMIPTAHYVAYKAGHALHTELARRIRVGLNP
ncbi:MAG: UDP-3-O-acyl-N-acetylglucosamine deacetylase [Microcoleaceae cyanobacterium]